MGPATYCSLCDGRHPEGLHYTVRGVLSDEPSDAALAEVRNESAGRAGHPAGADSGTMSAPFRNGESRHGDRTF